MAKLKVSSSASGTGTVTLIAPATSTDRTITLPDESITLGGGVAGIVSTADATAITITSSEQVGIGTSSPDRELTVYAANARIGIKSSDTTSGASQIHFGDTDNSQVGKIQYEHSDNSMRFDTNATQQFKITSDGRGLSQFTAKAWVYFEWEATIQDSHNVSSVSHPSTGNYTVNFTNNMGNTKYAAFADGDPESSTATNYATGISPSGRSTSLVKVRREKSDGSFNDSQTSVVIFGD